MRTRELIHQSAQKRGRTEQKFRRGSFKIFIMFQILQSKLPAIGIIYLSLGLVGEQVLQVFFQIGGDRSFIANDQRCGNIAFVKQEEGRN